MTRRHHMKAWLASLASLLTPLAACSQDKAKPVLSDEDAALKHKFRDIKGGELFVDATTFIDTAIIYKPDGTMFPGGFGTHSPTTNLRASYFGDEKKGDQFSVPKTLRMLRYATDAVFNTNWNRENVNDQRPWLGTPLVDVIVPVASRIPEAALDRVRQYKGSLTLKLRLMPETLLIGWEVKNGRGYPYKKDKAGNDIVNWEDSMIGGDFCERQVVNLRINGQLVLVENKGWYIDPKTGQKIQTDF